MKRTQTKQYFVLRFETNGLISTMLFPVESLYPPLTNTHVLCLLLIPDLQRPLGPCRAASRRASRARSAQPTFTRQRIRAPVQRRTNIQISQAPYFKNCSRYSANVSAAAAVAASAPTAAWPLPALAPHFSLSPFSTFSFPLSPQSVPPFPQSPTHQGLLSRRSAPEPRSASRSVPVARSTSTFSGLRSRCT